MKWIEKKFSNSNIALKFLENEGILRQYSQLIEKGHGKVAHAETTIIVGKKVEVLT